MMDCPICGHAFIEVDNDHGTMSLTCAVRHTGEEVDEAMKSTAPERMKRMLERQMDESIERLRKMSSRFAKNTTV